MAALIRPVSYAEILSAPNAERLMSDYAAECSIPELGPINPQRELYAAMEQSGAMQAFGVYEEGTLIGFMTVLIWTVPHYGKKIASTESIFLASERRDSGIGANMLQYIEEYAKGNDCAAIQYTAPVNSRFARLLAINVDRYRRTNSIYLRNLA